MRTRCSGSSLASSSFAHPSDSRRRRRSWGRQLALDPIRLFVRKARPFLYVNESANVQVWLINTFYVSNAIDSLGCLAVNQSMRRRIRSLRENTFELREKFTAVSVGWVWLLIERPAPTLPISRHSLITDQYVGAGVVKVPLCVDC